jgi:hypothetical protein
MPLNAKVMKLLATMRAGVTLHCNQPRGGPLWALSNGDEVDAATARLVVAYPRIVGVGDTLFVGTMSQTYRYAAA